MSNLTSLSSIAVYFCQSTRTFICSFVSSLFLVLTLQTKWCNNTCIRFCGLFWIIYNSTPLKYSFTRQLLDFSFHVDYTSLKLVENGCVCRVCLCLMRFICQFVSLQIENNHTLNLITRLKQLSFFFRINISNYITENVQNTKYVKVNYCLETKQE